VVIYTHGSILDPSIYHSIKNSTEVLIGKADKMYLNYNLAYKPYIVTGIEDLTAVHNKLMPDVKKEAYIQQIKNSYSESKFIRVMKKSK